MRYGIYSDIHGNLEALQAVLDSMNSLGVKKRICLGDLVGYCANPNECIDLIRDQSDLVILGNHDSVALGRESSENFNFYARRAIEWTRENLKPESLEFLQKLSYMEHEGELCFVHASPRSPADWYYVTSLDDAVDAFSFFRQRICFVGHTHWPVIVVMEGEQSFRICDTLSYTLEKGQRMLVNVGSVGQPRDRNPQACWAICDSDTLSVEIVRVPYDIGKAQKKMRENDFADFLVHRLSEGR
ncbi:MAG: metallophosphoesterase family protein [Fibrobacterota bacterium]|nr:metallophosphoesterase family protein [Fibrobacterota bacterium]QQS03725.1 MAG: metallophosphoesterase family protein [Fibrobacterota bacterium]